MGTGLADRVTRGNANGFQFRSAPLWGVDRRVFFLHDERTNNLLNAIEQHASSGSEANQVIDAFNMLSTTDKQNILDFFATCELIFNRALAAASKSKLRWDDAPTSLPLCGDYPPRDRKGRLGPRPQFG